MVKIPICLFTSNYSPENMIVSSVGLSNIPLVSPFWTKLINEKTLAILLKVLSRTQIGRIFKDLPQNLTHWDLDFRNLSLTPCWTNEITLETTACSSRLGLILAEMLPFSSSIGVLVSSIQIFLAHYWGRILLTILFF